MVLRTSNELEIMSTFIRKTHEHYIDFIDVPLNYNGWIRGLNMLSKDTDPFPYGFMECLFKPLFF